MNFDRVKKVQAELATKFPNISQIDVSRLVKKLQSIIDQMGLALQVMAFMCIFTGLIVLYAIINYQSSNRRWDIGLLKSLGVDFKTIKLSFIKQYGLLVFLASFFGIVICIGMSFALSYVIFDGVYVFDYKTPLFSLLGVFSMGILVSLLATNKSLKVSPTELLNP